MYMRKFGCCWYFSASICDNDASYINGDKRAMRTAIKRGILTYVNVIPVIPTKNNLQFGCLEYDGLGSIIAMKLMIK